MATKQFYATGDFRYGTRMMRAGDPVTLDGPQARLYTALGKITAVKPKAAARVTAPADEAVEVVPAVTTAPKPRRARGKKAAAKK